MLARHNPEKLHNQLFLFYFYFWQDDSQDSFNARAGSASQGAAGRPHKGAPEPPPHSA